MSLAFEFHRLANADPKPKMGLFEANLIYSINMRNILKSFSGGKDFSNVQK